MFRIGLKDSNPTILSNKVSNVLLSSFQDIINIMFSHGNIYLGIQCRLHVRATFCLPHSKE